MIGISGRWRAALGWCALLAMSVAWSRPAAAGQESATPSAAKIASAPSAEAFAADPFLFDPQLSPDGTIIAAQGKQGPFHALHIIRFDGTKFRMETLPFAKDYVPNWIRWAGNGKILIGTPGIGYFLSGIAVYDLKTKAILRLTVPTAAVLPSNVIHVAPDGSHILLDGVAKNDFDVRVWRIDLTTGKPEKLVGQHPNIYDYYADEDGVVRAGIGFVRGTYHSIYLDTDGKYRRTERVKLPNDPDSAIDRIIPRPGTLQGYAISNHEGGRFALYDYDLKTGAFGKRIFAHDEVDVDDLVQWRGGDLLGVNYTDDRHRVHWLDPQLSAIQAHVDRTLPGMSNQIVSTDLDATRVIVWSSAPHDPGAYYVFDRSRNKMLELARPYERLVNAPLSEMKTVSYTARDGLKINAYLTLPRGRDPRNLPLVMLPHGGPFVRDVWQYDPYVQFLASRGYAVLQPNFRGSTGYGRDFVAAGEGQWGRKMQDDVDDGARWLAAQGIADPKRVCIMGASYGGYAAMWASVRNPDIYRCAISLAGISDVPEMLRYDRWNLMPRRYHADWRERIKGVEKFDLDTISPIRFASRVAMPILIGHGGQDRIVVSGQSKRFHEALVKAGKPSEYVLYPDSAHGTTTPADTADFMNRVEKFLARHNPAEPGP